MARMSIDDKFLRDPRVIRLGHAFGWRRQEAMGRLLDVYAVSYDREMDVLSSDDIDVAAEHEGFSARMVEVGLGERVRSGIRISGAAKRIAYLTGKHDAGRNGGLKSGESRRNSSKHSAKHAEKNPEARGNPPDVVPDPVPDPVVVVVPDPVLVPDQEYSPSARAARAGAPGRLPSSDHALVVAAFHDRFLARYGSAPTWGSKQGSQVKRMLKAHPAAELVKRIAILFESPPAFLASCPPDMGTLEQHLDKLAAPSRSHGSGDLLSRLHSDIARREAAGET